MSWKLGGFLKTADTYESVDENEEAVRDPEMLHFICAHLGAVNVKPTSGTLGPTFSSPFFLLLDDVCRIHSADGSKLTRVRFWSSVLQFECLPR